MPVTVVVGAQWGDEGKGKIVDIISKECEVVARYQGGANAGHTIAFGDQSFVLHLIPSGVFQPNSSCLIGNGVVIDPFALDEEIEMIAKLGINLTGRLFISSAAHIILPYHKVIDTIRESSQGDKKIGTTGRGIGPAYVDKYMRAGIRVADIFDTESLKAKIQTGLAEKTKLIKYVFEKDVKALDFDLDALLAAIEKMKPYVVNSAYYINKQIKAGKNILVEGAQGALLDVDHGTYPFVTSSNPTTGGACTGLGIPPTSIDTVMGVVKAYSTRVGNGAFPSELTDSLGEYIRKTGHEYGATTGRPRRCGWLDLVSLNYSIMINGITEIALTKIDILNDLKEIGVCFAYELDGKYIYEFPTNHEDLERCKPVIKYFNGWQSDICNITNWDDIPQEAKEYVRFIEKETGAKVKYFSTGPKRESTMVL